MPSSASNNVKHKRNKLKQKSRRIRYLFLSFLRYSELLVEKIAISLCTSCICRPLMDNPHRISYDAQFSKN